MPVYEYICIDCKEKIDVQTTFSEKQKGLKVTCPKCGSKKISRVFGSFMVIGSSSNKSNPPICGSQCGPGCRG